MIGSFGRATLPYLGGCWSKMKAQGDLWCSVWLTREAAKAVGQHVNLKRIQWAFGKLPDAVDALEVNAEACQMMCLPTFASHEP